MIFAISSFVSKILYSFVTKYRFFIIVILSFYSYTEKALWHFQEISHFSNFGKLQLTSYKIFKKTISDLRIFYELESFNFEEINMYVENWNND